MLIIFRQPLADPGRRKAVAKYSGVTLHTGNRFIEMMAQTEADTRPDCVSVSVRNVKPDHYGTVRHVVTLIGKNNTSLAEYYGDWP